METRFQSAASQPPSEAMGIVIATVLSFEGRRAAKFTAPHNERVIQKASLMKIGQQARDGFVHIGRQLRMVLEQV